MARLTGVSANPIYDHLYSAGWWYRLVGDPAEEFLPAPDAQSYVSDTSVLTWDDVNGRGFRAVETAVVTNGGGPSGQVVFMLSITNLSETTPLSIDLFHMADLEGRQQPGNGDGHATRAERTHRRHRGIRHCPIRRPRRRGVSGAHGPQQQRPPRRGRPAQRRGRDNFDNTGLPFGPDDVTAGFQWTTTVIPPSGSATFVAGIAVNMALTLPAGSTTTTTVTPGSPTTTTTLVTELCDNCVDDDGDTLVDFEDSDCCATTPMALKKSTLRPGPQGRTSLKLAARLDASPIAATQDLTVQLRDATGVFCARIPAGNLTRRRKGLVFRDEDGALTGARGLERITLTEKRGGAKLAVSGARAELDTPAPGVLALTLGLRDPATAEASNRCALGIATFRAAKKGIRFP